MQTVTEGKIETVIVIETEIEVETEDCIESLGCLVPLNEIAENQDHMLKHTENLDWHLYQDISFVKILCQKIKQGSLEKHMMGWYQFQLLYFGCLL